MHQGHHGANHPVKDLTTGKVEIVSMNHGFAVDRDSLPANAVETHVSLFDGSNCGIALNDKPVFSVQYHPEASPGPHDSHYLFERFVGLMKKNKRAYRPRRAMRYQLVIFDFDGTLADSLPWFSSVINDISDRFRFKRIAPHEEDMLRTMDARALMQHLGIPAWKMPFIVRHMRKRKSRELDQARPFDGVDRMLRRLPDADITVALVSSNTNPMCAPFSAPENTALIQYYECGVSMFGKASRFRRVLRRSGIPAADAICIGDEIRDLEAAQKGRHCVWRRDLGLYCGGKAPSPARRPSFS